MQSQLVLNDIRPRPRIYSAPVINGAVETFLAANELSMILPDFSAGDEEWLRETFIGSVTAASSTDPWSMATSFADEMDDTVSEDYVELFEKFTSHLGQWQEQVLRDWIASGGAVNPLTGEVHRVEVDTRDGVFAGLAFNDPRYAETGKFTFLQDDARQNSISADGEITRTRILEWEMIKAVAEPSEDDLAVHAANQAIRAAREEKSRTQQLWRNAERQRDVLLSSNKVSDLEAKDIFVTLGFTDDADAARAANAILLVLAQRQLASLS
jgi:hypothetical protein